MGNYQLIEFLLIELHQRTADDRASKAAELEQKVALLEVMVFFPHLYGVWTVASPLSPSLFHALLQIKKGSLI